MRLHHLLKKGIQELYTRLYLFSFYVVHFLSADIVYLRGLSYPIDE